MKTVTKRSYRSKTYLHDDGKITEEVHLGDIHYKDKDGNFVESDIKPRLVGEFFVMDKHNYHLSVAKDFSAPVLMQYKNTYDGANHSFSYEPIAIGWYEDGVFQTFRNQNKTNGIFKKDSNSIYYKNAFGKGIDFEITFLRRGFKKEVVFPKEIQLPEKDLVVLFRYSGDKLNIKETEQGFILSEQNGSHASQIRPAFAVDGEGNELPIKVRWEEKDGNIFQIKSLPVMTNAVFPVRFDTVTDYNSSSAGDRSIYNLISSVFNLTNWNTVHDAVSGTARTAITTTLRSSIVARSNLTFIERAFFGFDTSSIGTGSTISDVSFFCYTTNTNAAKSGGDNTQNIVISTQASDTSIVAGDYDQLGTTSFGSIAIPHTASAWQEFVFNATGIANVNKTGYTLLGMRMGDDMTDTFVSGYLDQETIFHSVDNTNDPYLRVTYTAGGGGGFAFSQSIVAM